MRQSRGILVLLALLLIAMIGVIAATAMFPEVVWLQAYGPNAAVTLGGTILTVAVVDRLLQRDREHSLEPPRREFYRRVASAIDDWGSTYKMSARLADVDIGTSRPGRTTWDRLAASDPHRLTNEQWGELRLVLTIGADRVIRELEEVLRAGHELPPDFRASLMSGLKELKECRDHFYTMLSLVTRPPQERPEMLRHVPPSALNPGLGEFLRALHALREDALTRLGEPHS